MQYEDLISKIEGTRGESISEEEKRAITVVWNSVVECVAEEFPVLDNVILAMKRAVPVKGGINRTERNSTQI